MQTCLRTCLGVEISDGRERKREETWVLANIVVIYCINVITSRSSFEQENNTIARNYGCVFYLDVEISVGTRILALSETTKRAARDRQPSHRARHAWRETLRPRKSTHATTERCFCRLCLRRSNLFFSYPPFRIPLSGAVSFCCSPVRRKSDNNNYY